VSDEKIVIPRHGDLVVGFCADEVPVLLEVWIGGSLVDGFELEQGRVRFTFSDSHCIPVIALQYHEVAVRLVSRSPARISVIGAVLQTDMRRQLARSRVLFEGELAVAVEGMFAGCSRTAVAPSHVSGQHTTKLPNLKKMMEKSWRVMAEKKKHWLLQQDCSGLCIKEELMQRVWHPAKVRCLLGPKIDALD
jgi:hypothetical protein